MGRVCICLPLASRQISAIPFIRCAQIKRNTKTLEGGVFREKNFFEKQKRFALGTTLLKPFLDFECRFN